MWPWFVLGGADPAAPWALRAYAVVALLLRFDRQYVRDVWALAAAYDRYRRDPASRKGDPDAPPHRTDDPAVVARMPDSAAHAQTVDAGPGKKLAGTCRYCGDQAHARLIWFRGPFGKPGPVAVAYCGRCDIKAALAKRGMTAPVAEGQDYRIEPAVGVQ